MGNAAVCSSCHADKSVRAQGNRQELDKAPDYYGYSSEDVKEPGVRVSFKPQMRRRKGRWCRGPNSGAHWSGLLTSWEEVDSESIVIKAAEGLTQSEGLTAVSPLCCAIPHVCVFLAAFNFADEQRCCRFNFKSFTKMNIHFMILLESDFQQNCRTSYTSRLLDSFLYLYIHVWLIFH